MNDPLKPWRAKKSDDGGGSEGRKLDMKGSGGSARYPFLLKAANFNAAFFLVRSKDRTKQKAVDGPNPVPKRAERNQLARSGEWQKIAAKKTQAAGICSPASASSPS
jgi:hypothetical protein